MGAIAHLVLPGGILAETLLETLADGHDKRRVDWGRVHAWWTDERCWGDGHIGRHETRARSAGLARIGILPDHIHAYVPPEFKDEAKPDRSAQEYAKLLRRFAPIGRQAPVFDVLMVGVGRSGEITALFPRHEELRSTKPVVSVWDAPHASQLRMTMTLPTPNNATRVWLLATGTECAVSVGRARTDADPNDIPAAGAKGILETIWWLDEKAARAVPNELRYG